MPNPGKWKQATHSELRAAIGRLQRENDSLQLECCDLRERAVTLSAALTEVVATAQQDANLSLALANALEHRALSDVAAVEINSVTKDFEDVTLQVLAHQALEPGSLQREWELFRNRMPTVMTTLDQWTMGKYDREQAASTSDTSAWQQKRQVLLHSMASKVLRARSRNTLTMFSVAQGLDTFYQHIRECYASRQVSTQDSLHPHTIDRLRSALSHWIPRTPFQLADHMRLILLDNLDMYQRLSRTRIVDGEMVKSKMIHCIVIEEVLIDATLIPSLPDRSLFNSDSNWDVREVLPTQQQTLDKVCTLWANCRARAKGDVMNLLRRPAANEDFAPGITHHRSHALQIDKHSNSKADMAAVYDELDELLGPGHKMVVLDYQTFAISWFLKHRSPDTYKHYMFWGGELHRQMHSVDAIKHIWWESVIKPMAMRLGRMDVKLKFDANQYNNDEEFIRLLATGVLQYLQKISTPEELLQHPTKLLQELESSKAGGLHDVVTFLLYGGFFFVCDKKAMQTADAELLDWAWVYTSVLARACNKTNYAKYGLEMHRVLHDTHEGVRCLIRNNRTYRETDHPCTGRGMDCGTERVCATAHVLTSACVCVSVT